MNFHNIAFGLSFVTALAMTGCGSEAEDDPLAATWSNTECFGMASKPDDVESCTSALMFTNDLELELRTDWISLSATATNPGCTTTRQVKGQQWSADHDQQTFTLTGNGEATIERTNCVNDEDNLETTATNDLDIPSGDSPYTINGDTLTVDSGALRGTYKR